MVKWLETIELSAEKHSHSSEFAAEILLHVETFCGWSVSQLMITCRPPERQMWPQIKAVNLSGKCTVPWSSLWQRVILASSTSGPGWSSTCLHHWRGLRTLSPCSLALGLTYSLEHTAQATVQSWHLYSIAHIGTLQREQRLKKLEAALL